jgi:hypothetical protein
LRAHWFAAQRPRYAGSAPHRRAARFGAVIAGLTTYGVRLLATNVWDSIPNKPVFLEEVQGLIFGEVMTLVPALVAIVIVGRRVRT